MNKTNRFRAGLALLFISFALFGCVTNVSENNNSSVDETINYVNERIGSLSSDLINKINETIETTNDLQNEYEEKSFELDLSYNSIQNTIKRHSVSVKELKEEIALLKSEHKIKKAELERKYTSIRNKIEELESSGVHYEDEEYSSLVEKLFKVENEIKESDKNLKESVNAIESEIATLNKSYSDSMNMLKESRTLTISEIEAISTQLSELNDELINQIKSVNEEVKNLTSNVILYDTGVRAECPSGIYLEVVGRSSISKTGYMLANNLGIIDSSYKGNIYVALLKVNPKAKELELPYRIAQIIPKKVFPCEIVEVQELSQTDRGANGFGSSGK